VAFVSGIPRGISVGRWLDYTQADAAVRCANRSEEDNCAYNTTARAIDVSCGSDGSFLRSASTAPDMAVTPA
jgi:hypothetical protein